MTDAQTLLEVIEDALHGTSIASVTGSKAPVYNLELALDLLCLDGMEEAQALEWVKRMNNHYTDVPNVIFVSDEVYQEDLAFSVSSGSRG